MMCLSYCNRDELTARLCRDTCCVSVCDQAQVKHLKKLLHNFMRTCQGLLYHQRDTVQEEVSVPT